MNTAWVVAEYEIVWRAVGGYFMTVSPVLTLGQACLLCVNGAYSSSPSGVCE